MISNEQIKQCISECNKVGHSIGLRDISYVLLARQFDDKSLAYKSIYGGDANFNAEYGYTYDQTASIEYLKIYVEQNFSESQKKKRKKKDYEDISFDENKAYMLKLKKDTEDAIANGEIDKKDGLKILSDISCKLNDKFQVSDNDKDQIVQVYPKFNAICERCGVEIYIPTKKDLMDKYNLIEKE